VTGTLSENPVHVHFEFRHHPPTNRHAAVWIESVCRAAEGGRRSPTWVLLQSMVPRGTMFSPTLPSGSRSTPSRWLS